MSDDRLDKYREFDGPVPGGDEPSPGRRGPRAQRKAAKAYAKATRPWWKKKRFWLLAVVAVFVVAVAAGIGGQPTTDAPPTPGETASQQETSEATSPTEKPITVTADKLIKDLEANALKASSTYKGKSVVLTGAVSNVDASGDYIGLRGRDDFSLTNVQVFIGDEHLDVVTGLSEGDQVTVAGRITDVGEVMGYSIDADTITKPKGR